MRLYRYIGPKQIADCSGSKSSGTAIHTENDLLQWLVDTNQEADADGCLIVTFVVNCEGILLVADRRSEHVACAGRQPVLSAGELTIQVVDSAVSIIGASNQSTGYCPEPESWPAVAGALNAARIEGPSGFTLSCDFRLCPTCGNKNLIKDRVFACGVCGGDLPAS